MFDAAYFQEYSDPRTHKSMVCDVDRVKAYKDAIFASDIRNKVVLDAGCGTGLLAMFCAQAGAKRVYAVEACDAAAKLALNIIKINNFENIITIINSRLEDVQLPESVDVMVSEWMGACLFHEGMLQSVIAARDRFLKPGGLILPRFASLYIAPFADHDTYEQQVGMWSRDLYGLDYTPVIEAAKSSAFDHPWSKSLHTSQLMGEASLLRRFDLLTLSLHSLSYNEALLSSARFDCPLRNINNQSKGTRIKEGQSTIFHGLAIWFDVCFAGIPLCI